MQKVKCITKKYKKDKIISYQIEDASGKIMIVTPQQLKEDIRNKKVECVNLTLTSDNRLIDKTVSQNLNYDVEYYMKLIENSLMNLKK